MITIIGSHEVANFDEWKKGFEADEQNRAKAGLKTVALYASVNNPNEVTFIFEAPEAEGFLAMMNNPAFQEKMKNAGVISAPQIRVLNRR